MDVQNWPIDRLIHYARNPRKNDAVVDRMCSSIREFGFKIPVVPAIRSYAGCAADWSGSNRVLWHP